MPKPHEFFDHTADIGVHVFGRTLEELFTNAAGALYEALGQLQKSEVRDQKLLEIEAGTLDDLLHDWLAELLYEVEANHLLYDEIEIGSLTPQRVSATLYGGEIDFDRSQPNDEIKAITYHELRVEQLPDATWRATVIFDV
ncbi:MAG TPA: archease [Verrucomicrobiae bacterium]|nr:archease [Verrucomicrobiae bacterium]